MKPSRTSMRPASKRRLPLDVQHSTIPVVPRAENEKTATHPWIDPEGAVPLSYMPMARWLRRALGAGRGRRDLDKGAPGVPDIRNFAGPEEGIIVQGVQAERDCPRVRDRLRRRLRLQA